MGTAATAKTPPPAKEGPKYQVNIDGTVYEWRSETITAADIRSLAGIPASDPIELIDLETNVQRTLAEDEVVSLKPGMGFAKKIHFRRG